ncbi:protein Shroom2 isoform X2 [Latimeria chalumnae]|uniref:protein Shroom2 isoform X2 n=1 Tax=Latimeria chalumnae TaxID=7897 RepID=UPI0003C11430|nr:PREDICTED: protein Shroom2 isoform X2 [Latimeria chalumnae]|eukprot:XP_006000363.1 PREDICTED: protein Shroom2 isoform X2 [Latimeria chalumnae]
MDQGTMDDMDSRRDQLFGDQISKVDQGVMMDQRGLEGFRLVEVMLTGGAPWGFTLKGGKEHGEPLLITKIEEGSKAAAAAGKLQAGDEIISINDVEISGYRQEAICLVKGSHKTLKLIIKRNEPVRPHSWHSTKFSENQSEATTAYLTPAGVCSSWHSRNHESSSSHDLSHSWDQTNLRRISDQFSSLGSMDSLDHGSHSFQHGRLSTAKSNNSIDHLSNISKRDSAYSSYSTNSSTPDHTLSKSDTASTENVLYKVSHWDTGRYGNGRHNQCLNDITPGAEERQGHLQPPTGSGGRESPKNDDQPDSRPSSHGRSSYGPVWYIPEKKKMAPSPPPPPPPVRSDSFAATKVHDKALSPAYSEGSNTQNLAAPNKSQVRRDWAFANSDHQHRLAQINDRSTDPRRNMSTNYKTDSGPEYALSISADNYNNNQINNSRQYSLSSTDVRYAQPAYSSNHQRQYSDESTFYPNSRGPAVPKQQNSSFYNSIQERPTDNLQYYHPTHVRLSTTTTSNSSEQNIDNGGETRYYCMTARQPNQSSSPLPQIKTECWKPNANTEMDTVSNENVAVPSKAPNQKYHLPHQQESSPEFSENSGYCRAEGNDGRSSAMEGGLHKSNHGKKGTQKKNSGCDFQSNYNRSPYSQQESVKDFLANEHRALQKDTVLCDKEENSKICPQKTPMLHSLTQETKSLSEKYVETGSNKQPPSDSHAGKVQRRSDRFATTLRNEIQMRRAKLQKSKSAATLAEPSEAEEETENWKMESKENSTSSSDGSFSSSYKDHLKEAQARVLRATSFKRRDLELVPVEYLSKSPELKTASYASSIPVIPSEDKPSSAEIAQSKSVIPASGSHHISRIGGRKRFTAEQKLRSYSEPDKMNKVGVSENYPPPNPSQKVLGSFADRWKFFEETSKPSYSKPLPKQNQQQSFEEQTEYKSKKPYTHETGDSWHEKRARAASLGFDNFLSSQPETRDYFICDGQEAGGKSMKFDPQRLGTFAEYQASWKEQRRPPETRGSGRYHSADNILDAGLDEHETPQYVHTRSRSSPSADFCGKNAAVEVKTPADSSQKSKELASPKHSADVGSTSVSELFCIRLFYSKLTASLKPALSTVPTACTFSQSERQVNSKYKEGSAEEKASPADQSSEPKKKATSRLPQRRELTDVEQENRGRSITLPTNYKYSSKETEKEVKNTVLIPPPYSSGLAGNESRTCSQNKGVDNLWIDPIAPVNKKKGPAPQRPPPPKLDRYKRQEVPGSSFAASCEQVIQSRSTQSYSPNTSDAPPAGTPLPQSPMSFTERLPAPRPQESLPSTFPEDCRQHLDKAYLKSDVAEPAAISRYHYLQKPSMESSRSPSPQFAPQKLTDKPPVSMEDEALTRIEKVMDNNTTVKMVPIKIVHSESHAEKESRQNLLNNVEPPGSLADQEKDQIRTLNTSEQSYSLFCAYTRQGQEDQNGTNEAHQVEVQDCVLKENEITTPVATYVKAKEKNIDDLKSEELAREIVGKDKSLADILDPNTKLKTTMDLMEGIFPKDEHLLEEAQQRRKLLPKLPSPKPAEEKKEEETLPSTISLTTSSTYYSTSAPKAELLIKMKDMQQQIEEDSEEELDHDLSEKKQELIDSISKKLQVLREARESLSDDIQANNALGDEVEVLVKAVCKSNEFDKFRMFIGDLDKVVNLLLSLSGRLARVENALNNLDESASSEERRTLTDKQKLLTRQHEDAKELKENLDRRERVVFDILANYLSEDNLADYEHFVKMKSALIIEQRELEDKIKLGEEQLKCLTDSLSDRVK